jgi:hypothetical protein
LGIRAWRCGAHGSGRSGAPDAGTAPSGDFAGYLDRNLAEAYRLAVLALDDPIAAQRAAHDAALGAWLAASPWPARDQDRAFGRRFEMECTAALRKTNPIEEAADPALEAALLGLAPRDRLALARRFGLEAAGRSDERRADRALAALAVPARAGSGGAAGSDPAERLRALYAGRDPGAEAPLQLRLRLQNSLVKAEEEAAEEEARAQRSGWSFVVNAFLVLIVLSLILGIGSVVTLRSSPASADPLGDPATPLTITAVSTIDGTLGSSGVHVAASQTELLATFGAAAVWHLSDRQCRADVVSLVDTAGHARSLGQPVGHVNAIAADPYSPAALVTGLGQYCEAQRYASTDGGGSWASGAMPAALPESPEWLAFDPGRPGTALAYRAGAISISTDGGLHWTDRPSAAIPIGFDQMGRLVGWSPGKLLDSADDGATWEQTGVGPAERPTAGAATSKGTVLGTKTGLWWYPLSAAPSLIESGTVYSIAALGGGSVALGADAAGRPWLGTVDDSVPGISLATLPPELASLTLTGGQVAADDGGALVALTGPTSAIAFASFSR